MSRPGTPHRPAHERHRGRRRRARPRRHRRRPRPAPTPDRADSVTLRLGYFPNVTHAPALVGVQSGIFAKKLGKNVDARDVDLQRRPRGRRRRCSPARSTSSFVGPNPAINALPEVEGRGVRIVSGTASGGAFLVVKPTSRTPADLKGKTHRDAAARQHPGRRAAHLAEEEGPEHDTTGGGDVSILPAGQRGHAHRVPAGRDRRRVGARAVRDPAGQRGRRQDPRRRGDLWPQRPVRDDQRHRQQRRSSTTTPTSSRSSSRATSPRSTSSRRTRPRPRSSSPHGIEKATGKPIAADLVDRVVREHHLHRSTRSPSSLVQGRRRTPRPLGLLKSNELKGIYDLTLLNKVLKAAKAPSAAIREQVHPHADAPSVEPVLEHVRSRATPLGDPRPWRRPRSRSTTSSKVFGHGGDAVPALDRVSLDVGARASSSACSARRAAARARCSTSSPASTSRRRAPSTSSGPHRR